MGLLWFLFFFSQKIETRTHYLKTDCIWRVPDQSGVSHLYNMLELYHSGSEPSNYFCSLYSSTLSTKDF